MSRAKTLCLVLLVFSTVAQCARILGLAPSPSYSHQIVFNEIWKELSLRGHDVVVLTTDPIGNNSLVNLTEIDVHFSHDIKRKINQELLKTHHGPLEVTKKMAEYQEYLFEAHLQHPDMKSLLANTSEHFDLVIYEYYLTAYSSFGKKFACPYIGVLSIDLPIEFYRVLGNPLHPAVYSSVVFPYYKDLSFTERLFNFLYGFCSVYIWYIFNESSDRVVRKHFGVDYPSSYRASIDADLVLINANSAFSIVKPNIPQVIEFGAGVHIQPEKPLPKDIQEFLDGDLPVVYFSFGSNVLGKYMTNDMTAKLLKAFAGLPAKILWKYEDNLPNLPSNIKTVKWAPQQDILRHPNVKAFIMQCGYQSMEEAMYSGVPIVGIPFYGDQLQNSKVIDGTKIGVVLNKQDVDEVTLSNAVLEVMQNPMYRENQLRLAKISKDQPIYGIEKAVWWIEYVLRHKGAKHLKCPVVDLSFYEYYMLDTIGCIAAVLTLVAYIFYTLSRFLVRLCRRKIGIKEKSL